MMERFLKEYVKAHAETLDIELSRKQLHEIVNRLECEDEIWETLDSYITEELENLK